MYLCAGSSIDVDDFEIWKSFENDEKFIKNRKKSTKIATGLGSVLPVVHYCQISRKSELRYPFCLPGARSANAAGVLGADSQYRSEL